MVDRMTLHGPWMVVGRVSGGLCRVEMALRGPCRVAGRGICGPCRVQLLLLVLDGSERVMYTRRAERGAVQVGVLGRGPVRWAGPRKRCPWCGVLGKSCWPAAAWPPVAIKTLGGGAEGCWVVEIRQIGTLGSRLDAAGRRSTTTAIRHQHVAICIGVCSCRVIIHRHVRRTVPRLIIVHWRWRAILRCEIEGSCAGSFHGRALGHALVFVVAEAVEGPPIATANPTMLILGHWHGRAAGGPLRACSFQ
jgi:hypothetical protein